MADYLDILDEFFVENLNYERNGKKLARPNVENKDLIEEIRLEYEAEGGAKQIIVVETRDRQLAFHKTVVRACREQYPDAHFLFVAAGGKVFDLYNLPDAGKLRRLTYDEVSRNTRLFREKIQFFDAEAARDSADLRVRAQQAFEGTERVTKQFYDKFRKLHKKLKDALTGMDGATDEERGWYASLLLNRVMFIYFLQKNGALGGDTDYLLNKYREVEKLRAAGSLSADDGGYFRAFLLPLFFYGFSRTDDNPNKQEFVRRFGRVRYLNGGLFMSHPLEKKFNTKDKAGDFDELGATTTIDLPDETLLETFNFLNQYTWHLDARPLEDDSHLNPEVLGYIFEKYINQKELGAYYTQQDVTGYITENAVVPFALDKLRRLGHAAPDPRPWIAENRPPLEAALAWLDTCDDYPALRALLLDVLQPLSALDPACGSGAFLYAALRVLRPLYQALYLKLRARPEARQDEAANDFLQKAETEGGGADYFLTRFIVLNNLYGVDIVPEAVEICKLRLFLELAACLPDAADIEPLPDVDFNILAGNALVGGLSWADLDAHYMAGLFADRAGARKQVAELDDLKKEYQNAYEQILQMAKAKREYLTADGAADRRSTLKGDIEYLKAQINASLDTGTPDAFHWFAEFHDVLQNGGFDVVIGNPPYVEYSTVRNQYELKGYETLRSGNLYAFFIERAVKMLQEGGYLGYIVQLSFICTSRMTTVQNYIEQSSENLYLSSFDDRPGKLFDGLEHIRAAILISQKRSDGLKSKPKVFTSKYIRWYSKERDKLFNSIKFVETGKNRIVGSFPKIDSLIGISILENIEQQIFIRDLADRNSSKLVYFHNAPQYWIRATDFTPYFWNERDGEKLSTQIKILSVKEEFFYPVLAALNSTLFYWWFIIWSDCRHLNKREIDSFALPPSVKNSEKEFKPLTDALMENYKANANRKTANYKTTGKVKYDEFFPRLAKPIIDEIDRALAKHYGFTEEETAFLINYDLAFRMGGEEA